MVGKIDAYLDCVSLYSYFAFLYLQKNGEALKSHGVDVNIIPIFLGGVNQGSGNRPPWMLPAKAAYSKFDSARAKIYFDTPKLKTPDVFPIVSLLPQRCMCYVKDNHSKVKFEAAVLSLYVALWEENTDLSKPELMKKVLGKTFNDNEVEAIMAAAKDQKYKRTLTENTELALKLGAFGAPWFWVKNSNGQEEPFFGSDRFHFMWEYLGLPWSDVAIQPKSKI